MTALTAVPLPAAAAVVAGLVTSSAGTQLDKLRQPPQVTSEYNVCEVNIQREVKVLSTVLAGLPPFWTQLHAICTHLVTGPRVLHSGENS